jgi:DivIVA domain-containing protein
MNRESIERRDFPVARRGYDPAAVDAHLRAVVVEVEALARQAEGAGAVALGQTAAAQVRGILDAAQATAAEIEREAREDAQGTREEAAQDAERARAHVAALAEATAALRERVATLDGEVSALAQSLRGGEEEPPAVASAPRTPESAPPAPASTPPIALSIPPATAAPPIAATAQPAPVRAQSAGDIDGARLVALNMALNGDSREQADRYLAESFELADREKLLDEVYAAIDR